MISIRILLSSLLTLASAAQAEEQSAVEIFVGVGPNSIVEKVAISDDGKLVLTAASNSVMIWDYESGERIQRIAFTGDDDYHPTCNDITLALDNTRLLCRQSSVESDPGHHRISVADVATGQRYGDQVVIPKNGLALANTISHDGRFSALDTGGKIVIFDIEAGQVIGEVSVNGTVTQLSYSPDNKTLYLVAFKEELLDGLYAVDLSTWQASRPHSKKLRRVDRVALSGDGTKALAVSDNRRYELFDLETGDGINQGRRKETTLKKTRGLEDVWLSHDASVAIAEFYNTQKYSIQYQYEYPTWNPLTDELLSLTASEPEFGRSTHQQVSLSRDSRFVSFQVGIGNHKAVNVYRVDPDDFQSVQFGEILKDFVFTPDDQVLASMIARYKSAYRTERRVIDTGEVAKRYTGAIMAPLGRVFVFTGGKRALVGNQLWDLRTGAREKSVDKIYRDPKWHRVNAFATAPNGRHILTQSEDGTLMLLDTETAATIDAETPNLTQLQLLGGYYQFTPDGRQFAATPLNPANVTAPRSEVESTIQFWNVATGQYSHRIRIEGGTVAGFDISADGKSLLVATAFQQLMNGNWQAHNELVVYDLVSGVKQQVISKNDTRGAIYGAPRFLPGGGFYAGGVLLDEQGNERLNLEINAAILSHHVTASPDGKTLVTHEFGYLEGFTATYFKRLIDIKSGETLRKFGGSTGIAVYSPDSTRIYTTGGNGELETYDATSGELLATSYAFEDGQWATVTPDGYYTASNGASSYLNIRFAGETLPIDNFFETYYRPAVVSAAMGTRVTDDAEDSGLATANIREDFKLPPQVKFTSPANTSQSSKPSVTLTAEIVDRGGGIDEIRLYHNGKLIEGGSRGITITSDHTDDNQLLTRAFQVNLLPGENAFRLTAFSTGQRIESKSANLLINYDGRQATSDLFVLAVGVNEYKNASLNLNYGRPDAEAFVDTIRNRSQGIFNNIKVTAIYDQDATRSNMMAAFDAIAAQAGPEDAFLFFYAGHGVMSEPEDGKRADFYMALSEVVRLYGDNPGLEVGGISATEMTELTRNIQARKQMIVLDACQSGGAVQMFAMRGAAEQKAILQLARSAGLVVLASTGTEQYATEFASLGHGVFTYALLQGLAGSADGGRKDGKITVKELEAFINDEVPYLTEKHRGQAQYPNSYARGQDFPLGVIN